MPFGGVTTANDPWYYLDATGAPTPVIGGSSTPFGQLVQGQPGGPAFEETITGGVDYWVPAIYIYHQVNGNYDYGFAPTPIPVGDYTTGTNPHAGTGDIELPWVYYYAADAYLTLTDSVAADNPISISFSGAPQGSVTITSNAAVTLAGNIVNPNGTTTITAPSITEDSTASTLTSHNLNLVVTGGVGTATQAVNASLTDGGVLSIQAGSQGVYLNLGSGALLNTVTSTGDIVINATGGLDQAPGLPGGLVNVSGNKITLTSSEGEIGSAAVPLVIQANGEVNVTALGDIGLTQSSGDLQVGQIASTQGNVSLNAPGGSILNDPVPTWTQLVDNQQSQIVWQTLHLTDSADAQSHQTISAFEHQVNSDYAAYWQLLANGSVLDGVFTLNAQGLSHYRALAGLTSFSGTLANGSPLVTGMSSTAGLVSGEAVSGPGIPTGTTIQAIDSSTGSMTLSEPATISGPGTLTAELDPAQVTDAQVQTYVNNQYQAYVTFFNQNLGAGWMNSADFQTFNPAFSYQATAQQQADLESNAAWTTPQLMYSVAQVAVDPYAGPPVGLLTPNIAGKNVTLNASAGSIGQIGSPTAITQTDLNSGTLTAAQIAALANATAPEDVVVTSTGIEVSPTPQVFISATGSLNANAAGSITIQGASQDLTLNQLTAGGPVNITAQESILGTGIGTQISTPGNTVLKVGTGTVGSPSRFLNVNVNGQLHVYAPPGKIFISGSHPTSLTIAASTGGTSTYGQSVTFTATISDNGAGVPTGSVKFYDGSTFLGDGTLLSGSGNSATSTFTTSTLAAGVHASVNAVYISTGNFTGSEDSLSLTVSQASLRITANSTTKFYGQTVTFSGTAFTETGLVNGDTIAAVAESSSGAPASATAGIYNIVPFAAAGSGLSNYTITYVDGKLTVNSDTTSTAVVASLNPSVYGQAVTFTATVSNTTSGSSFVPTGSVQFVVDGSNFGSPVALDATGKATTSLNTLAVTSSPHTIQVLYLNADGNFQTSNNTLPGGQNVTPATTSTAVVASLNPSVYGQAVTFTATVSNTTSGSSFVPTGSVQFVVDGSNFGSPVALDATGKATTSLNSLAVNSSPHTIQVLYLNADGNFQTSNNTLPGGQNVTPATTSTAVVSSLNPSVYGQAVTYTATVSNTTSGSGFVPTGSVQFVVDGSNFGSPVALDATGKATTSLNTLAVNSSPHTIQVLYLNADGNFQTSNNTLPGGQKVTPAATSTVVISSANPSVYGQPVTFAATVSNITSGSSFVPTGNVQFVVDGSNFGAPVAVDAAGHVVSPPDAFLSGASHTIQAVYNNSDGNFISGSSTNLTQTVQTVAREADPLNPGLTDLFVGGTAASSHIEVTLSKGQITVDLHDGNTPTTTPLAGLSALVVYGQADNEHIQVDNGLTLPAFLFGGNGSNVHIEGGGGPTVEVGGTGGNNHLQGGSGRNLLIAGPGGGHLEGNDDSDILIGGTTSYDYNLLALEAILEEWNSTDSYLQRVADLQNAPVSMSGQIVNPNGSYTAHYYLSAATVLDDGVSDHLEGDDGLDWFFASLTATKKDKVDLQSGEVLVGIS